MMLPEGGAAAQAARISRRRQHRRRWRADAGDRWRGAGRDRADLGSGDGRIPILAAEVFGARGIGVELDKVLYGRAAANVKAAGVAERVTLFNGDLFDTDLSKATRGDGLPAASRCGCDRVFRSMQPGARRFRMSSAWAPRVQTAPKCSRAARCTCGSCLHVAGRWQLTTPHGGFTLDIAQTFQEITGKADATGSMLPLLDTSLWGDEIGFSIAWPVSGCALPRTCGRRDDSALAI